MTKKRMMIGLMIIGLVVGTVSLWPEDNPLHAWPGLVDISGEELDFAPRFGRNDPSSISTGTVAYWGRATDQDGKPMTGATVTAFLRIHFGGGRGPETVRRQIRIADDGTFTIAGGAGIWLVITIAKPGHTPFIRKVELHPSLERFRSTKDAPEELICWRNVGQGKPQNAEIWTSVPWPLCRHFRLDLVNRKVVGPEEAGDLEIEMPLAMEPFRDGKMQVPEDLGVTLSAVDGAFGFCHTPDGAFNVNFGPEHLPWQPSERHPLLNEKSFGGIRDVYTPFQTLSLIFVERGGMDRIPLPMRFREHFMGGGSFGADVAFRSRGDQVAGRVSLSTFFTDKQSGEPPGYFVRIYGSIAQGSRGWNESEPYPKYLLPDPKP